MQAVGKVPFNVNELKVDLASISAHKMYGPKGVGALYVRRRNPRVLLAAQIDGGGHERGMRSGTLNVPGIVGFGKAAELCQQEMAQRHGAPARAARSAEREAAQGLDEIYINGSMEHRLPHNLNISFAYVEGESLLMGINDVAVSSGSACTSASLEPSYVLKALGAGDDLAHSSIRFGLGRWTTEEEVDYVADKLTTVVTRLREMSPLYELAKEGVDLSNDAVGRRLKDIEEQRNGLFKQGHRSLREPAQRRLAAERRRQRRHGPGGRAGVRRRHEAAGQGEPGDGRHRRREVQDVRLRRIYAMCVDDDRILLCRTRRATGQSVGDGRCPAAAWTSASRRANGAIRELAEETGLYGEIIALADVLSWSGRSTPPPRWRLDEAYHGLLVLYHVRIVGGELRHEIGGSTDRAQWFARKDAEQGSSWIPRARAYGWHSATERRTGTSASADLY